MAPIQANNNPSYEFSLLDSRLAVSDQTCAALILASCAAGITLLGHVNLFGGRRSPRRELLGKRCRTDEWPTTRRNVTFAPTQPSPRHLGPTLDRCARRACFACHASKHFKQFSRTV